MECPLLRAGAYAGQLEWEEADISCLKEECGRWDKVRGQCVDESILEELRLLVGAAGMIADKMPTEGEFRK